MSNRSPLVRKTSEENTVVDVAGVAKRIGMVHERDTVGRWGEPVAMYRL